MDITKLLEADHENVSELFYELDEAKDDWERKREIFERIADALDEHSRLEASIFYAALRQVRDEEGKGGELVAEAIDEHEEIERLIARVRGLDPTDDEWDDEVEELRACVEHHVREEESEMFAYARESLTRENLGTLGRRMEERQSGGGADRPATHADEGITAGATAKRPRGK